MSKILRVYLAVGVAGVAGVIVASTVISPMYHRAFDGLCESLLAINNVKQDDKIFEVCALKYVPGQPPQAQEPAVDITACRNQMAEWDRNLPPVAGLLFGGVAAMIGSAFNTPKAKTPY